MLENPDTTEMMENPDTTMLTLQQRRSRRVIGGIALILIGLVLLWAMHVESESVIHLLALPAVGLIFIIWGMKTHQSGLIIPGSIVSGIGISIILTNQVFTHLPALSQSGLVLLCMAAGFLAIVPLTTLNGHTHHWPWIPGGILAAFGLLVLLGSFGMDVLDLIGRFWPLAFVYAGLVVLLRFLQRRSE